MKGGRSLVVSEVLMENSCFPVLVASQRCGARSGTGSTSKFRAFTSRQRAQRRRCHSLGPGHTQSRVPVRPGWGWRERGFKEEKGGRKGEAPGPSAKLGGDNRPTIVVFILFFFL